MVQALREYHHPDADAHADAIQSLRTRLKTTCDQLEQFQNALAISTLEHIDTKDTIQSLRARVAKLEQDRLDAIACANVAMTQYLPRALAAERRVAELEKSCDEYVKRSVAAMAIAEGEEEHEKIPRNCPMLIAVSELRARVAALESELHMAQRAAADIHKDVLYLRNAATLDPSKSE